MKTNLLLGLAALALTVGACAPNDELPLASMKNKTLNLQLESYSEYFTTLNLVADGCAQLVPGTVTATLNGHPMFVAEGWHDESNTSNPCLPPVFYFNESLRGLGPKLTYVIQDSSQTLRLVVDNVRTDLPVLEPRTATPKVIRQGQEASFGVTSVGKQPVSVPMRFDGNDNPRAVAPCGYEERAFGKLEGDQIVVTVPQVCQGPGGVVLCLEYDDVPSVTTCENATCNFTPFPTQTCEHYDVDIQ
jgi:hypothetical protein